MRTKGFVLLSGGIDSSTALAYASLEHKHVQGISIDYRQRHRKEMAFAKKQCDSFGAEHVVLDAGFLLIGGMLTDKDIPIPDIKYDQIEGVSPTYVPFRNGTMLSMIAAHAQRWTKATFDPTTGVNDDEPRQACIYTGVHAEDAHNWAYPDCTPEFIGAMANAIYIGTYHAVRLQAPLQYAKKHEIVTLGWQLGVKFEDTWSCYAGDDLHCGACPTCYARQQAFIHANVLDPTEYAKPVQA